MTIAGLDGFFFSANELQRLATLSDPANTSLRTATTAIADYRDQLKRQGTELIFVPVPPKAIIFPDKIDKDLKIKIKGKRPARLDSALQATYAALRAKGVRVIDPTDALLATRENKKLGPVFPRTAAVWSPRGAEVAAQEIAQTLKGAAWANQTNKDGPLITEASALNYAGTLTTGTAVAETLALRNIGRSADGKMRSVTFSQGGHPLALIGDHTILAWREANNPAGATDAFASLADQLAFEFQTTPDVFPGKTDGRNAARLRILREATNGSNPLGSAKVVLWVVQATDLALGDWKQVPLRLSFNLSQPPVMLAPPVGLIPDSSSPPRPPEPPAAPGSAPSSGDPALPQLPR
jgi:alginate O-acetyltransferase complex protein AlgJ